MKQIDPKALFRLSVLGPLVSRERRERGELQRGIRELAQREYAIPASQRRHLGEKTIEAWYYAWRRLGLEGLEPKTRADSGRSKIAPAIQEAVLAAKRENPRRSIRQILRLLEAAGIVASQSLSRSAIHRLLHQHGLSQLAGSPSLPEERRSFTAEFAGGVWYGDVMHGPRVPVKGQLRKTYLVSLIDDASRLVAHSAFCLGETALDVEGVLKQALLRRGVPTKLVVDNGAAWRLAVWGGGCVRYQPSSLSTMAPPTAPTPCRACAPDWVSTSSSAGRMPPRARASSSAGTGPVERSKCVTGDAGALPS